MKNTKVIMAAFAAIVMTFSAAAPAYAVSDGGVTAAEVCVGFSESKPYEDGEHEGVFVSEDGFIYGPEKFAKGTCRVIDYIGDKADIVIPKKIDGYKVTSISSYFEDDYMTAHAFLLNDRLKSVTILADIERISDHSFHGCKNLEKVVLPETLKWTGSRVFEDCTALESIDLPNGLEYVGDRFAWDSKWLAAREKSEKLVVICGRLISGRKAKGKVTVPANVSDIAGYAFNGCKGMTELVIPGTCKGIGEEAIADCPKLKKVTLKNGVKGVSNLGAIHDCPAVEKIVLPPSLDRENAGFMIWGYDNHATYYYYKGTGAEKAVKKALKTIKTIKGSVLPGKTKSLKLTASKGRIKVTWQTVSTATGYQIKISPDKTFKNGVKTKFVKDKTAKTFTFAKLGSGRKYYVRMRTYRTISGRKYYGNYTKARAAVVK